MTQPGAVLIFGGGWLGQALARDLSNAGRAVVLTSRDADRRAALEAQGWGAVDPGEAPAFVEAVEAAGAILVSAPPEAAGCPGAAAILPAVARANRFPDWIGYVSSTAVYGDRDGGWVFEDSALNAATLEGARRVRAEREWLDAGQGMGLTVQVFRLPALYGPGRSPFDRLRAGQARLIRKPGQVFNRIHADDVVAGLKAAMAQPRPGAIYNLVDDEPAPADVVIGWAARRLGLPQPPEIDLDAAEVSDGMRRFYRDSKRISNARAKAELGWRPMYPSWRDGLEAVLAAEA